MTISDATKALSPIAIAVVAAASLVTLTRLFLLPIQSPTLATVWVGVGIIAATFAIVAVMRFALGTQRATTEAGGTAAVGDDLVMRYRIAPLVISLGAGGTILIALITIGLIASADANEQFAAKESMNILSILVPVFSTWVGTIIAFYFSNESFRIAAQAAAGQGNTADNSPLNGSARMLPYEKLTKLELKTTVATGAVAEAKAIDMKSVRDKFSDTASRVIVFDANRRVLFVLRTKLDNKTVQTIEQYLKQNQNESDATNFRMLPISATVADGRRTLDLYKTLDIFITDHGGVDEPVKGWVPDDKLA